MPWRRAGAGTKGGAANLLVRAEATDIRQMDSVDTRNPAPWTIPRQLAGASRRLISAGKGPWTEVQRPFPADQA